MQFFDPEEIGSCPIVTSRALALIADMEPLAATNATTAGASSTRST